MYRRTVLSSDQLTYRPMIRDFTARASELPDFEHASGFGLVSSKTKRALIFTLTQRVLTQRDENTGRRRICYWTYKSTQGDFTATIYAD